MATAIEGVQTPLELYLSTSYQPDCDWIEGELRERNLGQFDHANLQGLLILYLASQSKAVRVLPEQRVKVAARRYRIPDLIVIPRENRESIITQPPLACLEILSPEDSVSDYDDRLRDYIAMGVEHIWVFDPIKQRAWCIDRQGSWIAVDSGQELRCGPLTLTPRDLFRLAAE